MWKCKLQGLPELIASSQLSASVYNTNRFEHVSTSHATRANHLFFDATATSSASWFKIKHNAETHERVPVCHHRTLMYSTTNFLAAPRHDIMRILTTHYLCSSVSATPRRIGGFGRKSVFVSWVSISSQVSIAYRISMQWNGAEMGKQKRAIRKGKP